MIKHTPGPWGRTTDARRIVSTGWHVTAPDGCTIAVVLGERSEELQANVRLITAAPELLAAAKELFEFRNVLLARCGAAGHRYSEGCGEWVCDPWTQAFKNLDAAIRKADG